jgi:hypothetical protein
MGKHGHAVALFIAVAGCGGKSGTGSTITNAATPSADGIVRVEQGQERRDCPEGMIEALAPGWEAYVAEEGRLMPGLDTCLRGTLLGDSVVVYASAQPDADSQSEEPWPARRVIASLDGKVLLEGPGGGGDWMSGAAELQALVDLDGDGVHEIIELQTDPMGAMVRVYHLAAGELIEAGTVTTSIDDGGYSCTGTWSVGAVAADGRRALVVDVVEKGEAPYSDYGPDPGAASCPGQGAHHYWLEQDGVLADDFVDPEAEEEE